MVPPHYFSMSSLCQSGALPESRQGVSLVITDFTGDVSMGKKMCHQKVIFLLHLSLSKASLNYRVWMGIQS